jgi:4-hydroxy-tetrahydrodipicolinate reductase
MIRVGVFGAAGRMGATVCDAVLGADGMELVAAVDPHGAGGTVPSTDVPIAADAQALLDAHV